MSRSWGHEVFVAVDQVVNAIFGGYSDESISARSFRLGSRASRLDRWDQWRVMWVLVDFLFLPQDWLIQYRTGFAPPIGHCERAYQAEVKRTQLPPEYRPTTEPETK